MSGLWGAFPQPGRQPPDQPVRRRWEAAALSSQGVRKGRAPGVGNEWFLCPTWALVSSGAEESLFLEHEGTKRRLIWSGNHKHGEVQPFVLFLWCPTGVGPALWQASCGWISKQRKRILCFVFFSLKSEQECFAHGLYRLMCKARVSGCGVYCVSGEQWGSSACEPVNCVKWAG